MPPPHTRSMFMPPSRTWVRVRVRVRVRVMVRVRVRVRNRLRDYTKDGGLQQLEGDEVGLP